MSIGPGAPETWTGSPVVARSRSAGVRAHATQAAPVDSATVRSALTRPPDPRRIVPRGPGSNGARLLATIGAHGARTRLVYLRIEPSLALIKVPAKAYIMAITKFEPIPRPGPALAQRWPGR